MERQPLKFTTAFGVIVMILGFLLEAGSFFYQSGSGVSAESVFTGAVVLTVGHAFYGLNKLWFSLTLTAISSIGVGYFVLVQTNSWLWTVILTIAFFLPLLFHCSKFAHLSDISMVCGNSTDCRDHRKWLTTSKLEIVSHFLFITEPASSIADNRISCATVLGLK